MDSNILIEKNYDLKAIGPQLIKLRKYFHLSQKSIGEMVNVTNQYWCYLEKNKKLISLKLLIQLSQIFKVDVNYFLFQDVNIEEYLFSPVNHQLALFKREIKNPDHTNSASSVNNHFLTSINRNNGDFYLTTSVGNTISTCLDEFFQSSNRILTFFTPSQNGSTTAIRKYFLSYELEFVYIDNAKLLTDFARKLKNSYEQFIANDGYRIIIENVEVFFPEDVLEMLKIARRGDAYIIFNCKEKHIFAKNFPNLTYVSQDLFPLNKHDILFFLNRLVPDFSFPENQFYQIENKIKGNIVYLLEYIKQISDKKLNLQESLEIVLKKG